MIRFSAISPVRALLTVALIAGAGAALGSCGPRVRVGTLPLQPDSMSVAHVLAIGDSTDFNALEGAGDEQRLAVGPADSLRYGPLARVSPAVGLDDDNERFATGRVVARIESDGDYPKLGIRTGVNYLVVRRVGADSSGWRAWMYAKADSSRTELPVTWEDHGGDERLPKGARWLWRADDEDLWTRCGSGCCTMRRAFM